METFNSKSVFILVIILIATELHAQEAILTGGGNGSGSGGSFSYSVGQVFYSSRPGLHEGVQPFFILTEEKTTGTKMTGLNLAVYPNPVTHELYLETIDFGGRNMMYRISDMNGRLLEQGEIKGSRTVVKMVHYPPSGYIINLVGDNRIIKSFKIIKK